MFNCSFLFASVYKFINNLAPQFKVPPYIRHRAHVYNEAKICIFLSTSTLLPQGHRVINLAHDRITAYFSIINFALFRFDELII